MSEPTLPDVHVFNLEYLLLLQTSINRDTTHASLVFGIDRRSAEILKDQPFETMRGLAYSGDRCIAVLRYSAKDLEDLLRCPPDLQQLFGAVRHAEPPTPRSE